jgi:hypothetical protein
MSLSYLAKCLRNRISDDKAGNENERSNTTDQEIVPPPIPVLGCEEKRQRNERIYYGNRRDVSITQRRRMDLCEQTQTVAQVRW